MTSRLMIIAAFGLIASAPAMAAQNLVINGGFETGDFSNWTLGSSNDLVYVDAYPQEGDYAALFQNPTDSVVLNQTLTGLNARGMYNVSFYLANDTAGDNNFDARFNGKSIFTAVNSAVQGYVRYTGMVQASTLGDIAIAFDGRNGPGTLYLDNVSVSAVPEATTWAMMIGGIGLVGAVMRRRSALPVVTA